MKIAVCALLATFVGFSQNVKVVALSEEDAAEVKTANDELDRAIKNWDAVRERIEHRYISDAKEESLTASGRLTLGSGFLISDGSSITSTKPSTPCDWSDRHTSMATAEFLSSCREWLTNHKKYEQEQAAEQEKARKEEAERVAKLPKTLVFVRKEGWACGFDFDESYRFIVPSHTNCSVQYLDYRSPITGFGGIPPLVSH